jgi:ABC-type bacteriocin/lantibiotic exporter with double-glycine peptidase domain
LVFIFGSAFDIALIEVLGAFVALSAEISLLVFLGFFLLKINLIASISIFLYFGIIFFVLEKALRVPSLAASVIRSQSHLSAGEQITSLKNTYREVVVFDKKNFFANRFNLLRSSATTAHRKLIVFAMAPKFFFEAAFYLGIGILFFVLFFTTDRANAISQFVFYLACGSRLLPSLIRSQGSISSVRANSGSCIPMFDVLTELKDNSGIYPEARLIASNDSHPPLIFVKNLDFCHGNDVKWRLEVEEFILERGQRVGIVGASGSGKSTFVDILLGVQKDFKGDVRINNLVPLGAENQFGSLIGYVPQKVHLFPGTIIENVSFSEATEANQTLVELALVQAGIGEFIESLPLGVYTSIQEAGNNLSGGQVQRIGIARALYRQPRLLVLDEATSALDSVTETLIMQTVEKLSPDISILAISHKESILSSFDAIYRFKDGKIVSHEKR